MPSAINALIPVTGSAVSKAAVRGNWAAAKAEILALQARFPSIEDYFTGAEAGVNSVTAGIVDCTTGIQAGIDAVAAAGGGYLLVPAKVYGVSSTITLKKGVHFMGFTPEGWFEGYNWGGSGFLNTAPNQPTPAGRLQAMAAFNTATDMIVLEYLGNAHRGIGVSGLILDGHRFVRDVLVCNGTSAPSAEDRIVIDRVYTTGALQDGLTLINTIGAQISRHRSNGNNRRGINLSGCADSQFTDCWLQANLVNFYVGSGSLSNAISGGKNEDSNTIGLYINPGASYTNVQLNVTGVTFQGNQTEGVYISSAGAAADAAINQWVQLVNCYFTGNYRTSDVLPNAGYQVRADKSARCMVSDSYFLKYASHTTEGGLRAQDNAIIYSSGNKWSWATALQYLEETGGQILNRVGDVVGVSTATPTFQTPVGITFP